jgi:hypothetical protein
LKRWQVRLRTFLALPVIVGLLLVVPIQRCVRSIFLTRIYDGLVTVPLVFVIVDDTTEQPIENALIRIYNLFDPPPEFWEARTGPDGCASIKFLTMAAEGFNSDLGIRLYRSVGYGRDVYLSASGFQDRHLDLSEFTHDPRFHYDASPPPIVFRLRAVEASVRSGRKQ